MPFEESWEKPRMIYGVEHLYDGSIDGLGAYGSFGSLLDDPDKFVVMLFIGSHDKKGREIYDGDIIRFRVTDERPGLEIPGMKKGVVQWDYCEWSFGGWRMPYCKEVEVIGNIHENPELLK